MSDSTPDTTRFENGEKDERSGGEGRTDGRSSDVAKARDLTTRRTRRWKRAIGLSVGALGLAVAVRRLRGRGRDERRAVEEERAADADDDGTGLVRRVAIAAVTAALAAAVRRRRGGSAAGEQ